MTAIQLAGIAGLVFRMAVLAMGVVAITVTSSGRPYLIGFVVTYVIAEVCSFAAPIFVAPQSMPIVGILLTLLGLANLLLMAVALIRESRTASDMLRAVRESARDADAVIMAAAVADYRPVTVAATKLKKQAPAGANHLSEPVMSIDLTTNPDILVGLVSDPPRPGQIIVGFAAETGDENGDVLFHGRAKARRKGAHLLAVNAVGEELGFGDVPNAVVVLDADGTEVARGQGSKMEVARLLISLTADLVDAT